MEENFNKNKKVIIIGAGYSLNFGNFLFGF
jgi:hypothetical protein